MDFLQGKGSQLEKGSFQHKIMMKEVQINKDNQRKKVAAKKEVLMYM